MGDHDQGYLLILVNRFYKFHYFLTALAVKVSGRLIGQDQFGTVCKSPCYCQPLLLPA